MDIPEKINLPFGHQFPKEILDSIPIDSKNLLLSHGTIISLPRHGHLFNQGDSANYFYLLLDGYIKLTQTQGAHSKVLLDIVAPGDFIGIPLMQLNQECQYPVSAQVLNACIVLKCSKDFFKSRFQNNIYLNNLGAVQTQSRLLKLQQDRHLPHLHLNQKVAYFLTERIAPLKHIKITRQDIADAIGSTSESVIRVISEWAKEGLISSHNQEIQILNYDQLKALWKN